MLIMVESCAYPFTPILLIFQLLFNNARGEIVIHHNLYTAHKLNPQFAIIAGYRVRLSISYSCIHNTSSCTTCDAASSCLTRPARRYATCFNLSYALQACNLLIGISIGSEANSEHMLRIVQKNSSGTTYSSVTQTQICTHICVLLTYNQALSMRTVEDTRCVQRFLPQEIKIYIQ